MIHCAVRPISEPAMSEAPNPTDLRITVNGAARTCVAGTTVADLLAELEIGSTHTAVERNRQIVPKTAFAATPLEDGDQLEIVTLVGGG